MTCIEVTSGYPGTKRRRCSGGGSPRRARRDKGKRVPGPVSAADNLAVYTRVAPAFLKPSPGHRRHIQFRMHDESGLKRGGDAAVLRFTVFATIKRG